MGEGERAKTAAVRFSQLRKTDDLFGSGTTLEALEGAFSVEKMSKAFFNEYRVHYGRFTAYLTGEDENSKEVGKPSSFLKTTFRGNAKAARDFIKKMLGRIVFLYFLQKKGWLGVPENETWGQGDENLLSNLYRDCIEKDVFYSDVLVPLFFHTLNKERENDLFKIDAGLFKKGDYHRRKIPLLNGGLFEEDEVNTQFLTFPKDLFAGLFEFFDRYNFTVYEDSPEEHTVAVDPEMLGHIFENLLEDNKDKGAFYTPKEIVHYMCQESLIEFLHTKLTVTGLAEDLREHLEKFVKQGEAGKIIKYERVILTALYNVKVCDPAIGSGAFPMGMLMEIFRAVETLYDASPAVTTKVWKLKGKELDRAAVKLNIIQNSIYGVDIEQGAVDIARLRFWLSLVVDEDTPQPLPNLDYKIVVGDSLLSKFNGVVIDINWNPKYKNTSAVVKLITEQMTKVPLIEQKQRLFFEAQHGNKKKLKREIRNLKIDILLNQLELTRIEFQQNNQILGGYSPTAKEQIKNLENKEKMAVYNDTIGKIKILKADKDALLEFFDWKLDFPEVMNENVAKEMGFDIVIANPPYVKVQNLDYNEIDLFKRKYFVAYKRLDISNLFFELCEFLLHKQGMAIYISSNQFLTAEYGRRLRQFLTSNISMIANVDFGGLPVFENVITYVSIFKIRKTFPAFLQYYKIKSLPFEPSLIRFTNIDYKTFGEEKWIFSEGTKASLLKKIETNKSLSNYAKCSYGIISGADNIFILNKEEVKSLKIEEGCYLPLIRAKNCKRYSFVSPELYIIYPYELQNGNTLLLTLDQLRKKYPNTYKYLLSNKKALEKRKDSRKTFENSENWYSLTRFGQLEVFKKSEKIVFPGEQKQMKFSIDNTQSGYSGARVFGIIISNDQVEIKCLLGILNSRLIEFYIQSTSSLKQGDYYSMSSSLIDALPMPQHLFNKNLQNNVNKVLKINLVKSVDNAHNIEMEIDLIVYKLYELSYEEACLIEDNTDWMSKEEYETLSIEEGRPYQTSN